jgi:alpha-beta hydrolase superfamily lysophospholipase
VVRSVFWDEMKGRAQGASAPTGGAALFAQELFRVFARMATDRYKVHLVGHSAGSIYLAHLYRHVLEGLVAETPNVALASVHFLAPAITVADAAAAFMGGGRPIVPRERFRVHTLKSRDEENDSIQIYPSSLLTYVADHLEAARSRVPVLGIRADFVGQTVKFATQVDASVSVRHGEFDDPGHEIEGVFGAIGAGEF